MEEQRFKHVGWKATIDSSNYGNYVLVENDDLTVETIAEATNVLLENFVKSFQKIKERREPAASLDSLEIVITDKFNAPNNRFGVEDVRP